MMKNNRRTLRLLGFAAAVALTLGACGSSTATDSGAGESVAAESVAAESVAAETPAADSAPAESVAAESVAAETPAAESVAAESAPAESAAPAAGAAMFDSLPQAIKDAKVVKVGSDVSYAPYESFAADGKTVEGFDADYAAEVGKLLGVEFVFENGSFDSLITGVEGGRYDVILSGMTDNKERQKQVDFVDYQKSGFAILVKKGNPSAIKTPEDLCGKKVGLQAGTSQIEYVKALPCGDKKIEISEFPSEDEARLAVSSGRVEADVADLPPMSHFIKTAAKGGDFEIASTEQYETGLLGMAVSKKLPELRDAVQKATNELMANGTYDKLLAKWGLEATKIDTATVNGG
jgi:polar amino acid transport system substrate-binding protein